VILVIASFGQRAFRMLRFLLICLPSFVNASGDVGLLVLFCVEGSRRLDKLGY
jgi:hypothetical protein